MPKLIVHIGQPKTGTTTLQHALNNARTSLLEHGVLYPTCYHGNNHSIVATQIGGAGVPSPMEQQRYDGDQAAIARDSAAAWKQTIQEIKASSADTVILSSERFFRMAKFDGFERFKDSLRTISSDITIVAYVRAPASHYLSMRQQRLKYIGLFGPPDRGPIYERSFQPYLDCPDVTLNVHKFDRAALIENDIRADFAQRYLPSAARELLMVQTEDKNETLSAEAMAVLEDIWAKRVPSQFRSPGPVTKRLTNKIRTIDAKLPGMARPAYKPGIARVIHGGVTDQDWLESRLGIRFDPPAKDSVAEGLCPADLTTVHDICQIDEERYQRFWRQIEPPRSRIKATVQKIWGAQRYIARGRSYLIRAAMRTAGRT